MNVLEGTLSYRDGRFAIVAGRFNEVITLRLLEGASGAFRRHGVPEDAIDVAWVPGAVEIPVVAQHFARSGRYAAVVTLGAVIRGATSHYDHVCSMAAAGVARAAQDTGLPVVFGVLTTDTLDQAIGRAGGKAGNKGADAATTALEMASLMHRLGS